MILRVGVIMIVVALALAAGVTAMVSLRAVEPAPAFTLAEPLAVETRARENEPDLGEKLEIDDEPAEKLDTNDEPAEKLDTNDEPAEKLDTNYKPGGKLETNKPSEKPETSDKPAEKATVNEPAQKTDPLPDLAQDWERPSQAEVAATNAPRYYQPQRDSTLALTVEGIGLYDVPVINSSSLEALDRGVIHIPQTPMPWEEREQKNVYLAGHRLGYEGTGSRMVFYNLDKLRKGDPVVLEDSLGTPYEYRVSEVFVAEPDAEWVVDPVRDRDMVTLQTCTMPDFENRLIVRADRV